MIKRSICVVLSGIAGALLGLSLFLAASLGLSQDLSDAQFARDGIQEKCDRFISVGAVTGCRIIRLVATTPETDLVYGGYVYEVLLEGGRFDGSRIFLVVLTEGESVIEVK